MATVQRHDRLHRWVASDHPARQCASVPGDANVRDRRDGRRCPRPAATTIRWRPAFVVPATMTVPSRQGRSMCLAPSTRSPRSWGVPARATSFQGVGMTRTALRRAATVHRLDDDAIATIVRADPRQRSRGILLCSSMSGSACPSSGISIASRGSGLGPGGRASAGRGPPASRGIGLIGNAPAGTKSLESAVG
jgi:hypothetical protein